MLAALDLAVKVALMRTYQRTYFATRNSHVLDKCKKLEADVDAEVSALLRHGGVAVTMTSDGIKITDPQQKTRFDLPQGEPKQESLFPPDPYQR